MSLSDIELIGEHLEKCPKCLTRLESLQPGPLEKGMRQAAESEIRPEGDDDSEIDSAAKKVLENVFPEVAETVVSHHGRDLFQLDEKIGTTEIADLFIASDLVMECPVMIAIPWRSIIASEDHRSQLILDGNNASWLKHENILRVIQFGNWDEDCCYLAMPKITNCSLEQILSVKPAFGLSDVLTILGQICSAIQYAHHHNVIHRHLNPANIFVARRDLHVLVAEFGLVFDGRYHFGLIEPIVAPTRYNSPEAIRNEPRRVDFRTDIFSIGAILDSLLDCAPNLDDENMDALRTIAHRCQRPSRKKRFQTIIQMINEVGEQIRVPV